MQKSENESENANLVELISRRFNRLLIYLLNAKIQRVFYITYNFFQEMEMFLNYLKAVYRLFRIVWKKEIRRAKNEKQK